MNYRVREDLPCEVQEIENLFIPLRDGCRLAARVWMPADAETHPVPAVFEYIPYRKRDFMRARDEPMHRYLAGHGYCALRIDLRGSGDSSGILHDEYLPQEQLDALEVIEWLTRQPWCDGNVGMTGISWGGFNSLAVAAHNPPALKAIMSLCASDDRYADDAHYMGGCLLNENQIWGTVLFALNALPPDPEIAGAAWREMWLERLEHDVPFPATWLRHQRRDAYWQQASVCEDFAKIRCAVYAIGGWADGYSNAVPRLLAGLTAPRKGLIGPWAHTFPHSGVPGPAIGYLQECIRWWDHWLKGRDDGLMREPMLRVWMQDSEPPEPVREQRAGRWIVEPTWPSIAIDSRTWYFAPGGALHDAPSPPYVIEIQSPQTTGSTGGDWCGFGADGETPMDQRADDGRSLTFDTSPLAAPIEILGAPTVQLRLSATEAVALLAVRLTDVAPDGTSSLVTYGLLNLTHRDSHEHPAPLVPGEFYDVTVILNDIAHAFPAGHALRLAVSTNYWPLAWPAPHAAVLSFDLGACTLALPVREPRPEDLTIRLFDEPEAAPAATRHIALRPPRFVRSFERDLTTNETTYRLFSEGGDLESGAVMHVDAINMDLGHTVERRFTIGETDPLSARAEVTEKLLMRRAEWNVRIEAMTRVSADAEAFRVEARLRAIEGDEEVFQREWDERIPRDLL